MKQIEITFIVPAFNVESTIERAIESILNQTEDHYKIIIVNDGSTDSTELICQRYVKRYPEKISYFYQKNKGLGGARNSGLGMVNTEYVAFLDSDDWLMPEYTEKVLMQIRTHIDEPPEIIKTLPRIYNENSKVISDWYDKELFKQIFHQEGQIINPQLEMSILQTDVNQCRNIYQMSFLRRVHFQFREGIKWEDVYPHFFLLSQCHTCMGIESVGFYYRKGSRDQITATRGKDRMDLLIVYGDLVDYIRNDVFSVEMKNELIFSAMRIVVSFAMEGIRMADVDTRKDLVQGLNIFFKKLPRNFCRNFIKKSKGRCARKDLLKYQMFLSIIRHRMNSWLLWDYLYKEAGEKTVKKILGMK